MPPDALRTPLEHGAQALGLSLSPSQLEALLAYVALLSKWNQVYNLTAVRQPAEMLTHHLLDSLAVVPPLLRDTPPTASRVLDVGSGGGLPGVVLAIVAPQWQVTCVDSVGKKTSFVQQVAAELKLPNLLAQHTRIEKWQTTPFDLIVSRAFASLGDFVTLTSHLLAPAGRWAAMKGQQPIAEITQLPAKCAMFHVEQLIVPGLDAERCLVWLRPASQEPA